MTPLELSLALITGGVSAAGAWAWVRTHSHPELVRRTEVELLHSLIRSQHAAVLRELGQLRDSLDQRRGRG